ncbi:MAG: SpoIIE family protein phosphatase [Planctomycetales bacterium]|nr:SpoIIE family protein phosphatase [Planctomycetales bacterium]
MAHLTVIAGMDTGAEFPLPRDKMVLGRNPECDIVVIAPAVSRRHAMITQVDGDFYVEDLDSRNGTFVNEIEVSPRRRLAHADNIRICDVIFQFHSDSPDLTSAVTIEDDVDHAPSSIMGKLDISSISGSASLTASPETKLKALVELTTNLGRSLSLDEVLPPVLDSLFRIFLQADRGFIVLRTKDGKLVPRWQKFHRPDQASARISRSILNHVLETRQAILSADAKDDSRFDMSESIANLSIRSLICAPLIDSEGKILGAIQIDTLDQRNRFRESDLEVLAAVASQAAIAITNAELHEQALRQRAIQRDLELAQRVQTALLPGKRPAFAGFEFYDYYRAANRIGGDYFDYVALPDGRLATILADVSGHGIAAALLMAKLSAEARFTLATIDEPSAVMSRLNDVMCEQLDDGFVTMVLAVLHREASKITLVNAGHAAPLVRHANGTVDEVGDDTAGFPLGVVEGYAYEEAEIPLGVGELFLMYTDGIPEAMDEDGRAFGNERVQSSVQQAVDSLEQFGTHLISDVRTFTGGAPQSDDMCLVCFRRNV